MVTQVENIPEELKSVPQWVCWSNADKVPRNPHTGGNAKSNDKTTWGSFEDATKACSTYGLDGIGFMFSNGYFGVDLDHCLDKQEFCNEFVETLQSYSEISKSGDGLHIICKGTLPQGGRRKDGVEMYDRGRYFICTGNIYNQKYKQIADCTDTVKILHSKYIPSEQPKFEARKFEPVDLDDREIIDKASSCRTGDLFKMLNDGKWEGLYPSQSEADLAFCNQLAFWTQKNARQMDRIFRNSGLMRDKWDKKRNGQSYGEMTISRAIENCVDVYEPTVYSDEKDLALALFKDGSVAADDKRKSYDMTETGNAHRLVDKFGNVLRYSYNRRKWFYWDGKVWRSDESGEIKKLSDVICADLKREAFMESDEKEQEKRLRWANRTASSRGKENMIKEAQHLQNVPVMPEEFDRYRDYLNVQNGVVNLRNGELLKHDSKLMMSKICVSEYDETDKEPTLWLSFLDDVTNGDKSLQDYIQKCVGYSLSGSNREQCAYFLYGMGNNGKSTFLDTISDLLGTYSSNAQPDTLMMKKWDSGANSDIARLKSARFVTCEEPTEGVRLNEGLLKQLTGGSKITCRFLYSEEFEYTPEFKIWVATNHKPIVRGTDLGIWRRIKLIPFEVNIPADKVDKLLKYKLRKEFPQILHWAVQGCIRWQKEGIKEPACVQEAIKEYKVEMDLLASFMEQCIIIDYNNPDKIMASDLFGLYSKWAKANNEYEMSSKKFFRDMNKKVPDKGRNARGVFYVNIRYTEYAESLLNQQSGYRQYNFNDFN